MQINLKAHQVALIIDTLVDTNRKYQAIDAKKFENEMAEIDVILFELKNQFNNQTE